MSSTRMTEWCPLNQYPTSDTPLIVFVSDFGIRDPYVGIVKGVVHSIAPEAKVIDLTHEIHPQDITAAAYLLSRSWRYFPEKTIFLCVVDPGVGSDRATVAAKAGGRIFVAPDNGILGLLEKEITEVRRITEKVHVSDWHVSATFHGRDIFGPAAALLARGMRLEELGPETALSARLDLPVPQCAGREIRGQIVWFDRFGNGATNISSSQARQCLGQDYHEGCCAAAGGRQMPLLRTFSDVPAGRPLALVNSFGDIEICVNGGSAKELLGLKTGDPVRLFPCGG